MLQLAVYSPTPERRPDARRLAEQLQLPQVDEPGCMREGALLVTADSGLQLQMLGKNAPGPVLVDFGSGQLRHRRKAGQNELLGRAIGVGKRHNLRVVDATAGLGRDSFVLADLGCQVTLLERSPVVHALLLDGLQRALAGNDEWLRGVCSRMRPLQVDSRDWLVSADAGALQVIYLDPMFPQRKKNARVKKDMWLFQGLLGDDVDAADLLELAIQRAEFRVVVKRPVKAPLLAQKSPAFSLSGKTVRFDVYSRRKLA